MNVLVQEVNALIRRSFGPFHRGNFNIIGGGVDGALTEGNRLHVIATKITLLDPQFGGGVRGVLSNDGSAITVIRKYERRARVYATLFQEKFGREAEVQTVSHFEELPD